MITLLILAIIFVVDKNRIGEKPAFVYLVGQILLLVAASVTALPWWILIALCFWLRLIVVTWNNVKDTLGDSDKG